MSQTWPWQWPFRCHHPGEASCADRGKTRIGGHFDRKSLLISFIFLYKKMADGGNIGWPKITFDRISRHIRSITSFFFSSVLSIAFLAISHKYTIFFSQDGCRWPFWMTKLSIAFLVISDQYAILIFFFTKWLSVAILDDFRLHFSPFQINTQHLFFSLNGCRRPFWMTENHFRSHFSTFQINNNFIFLIFFISTFDRISRHFRWIHNFVHKMAAGGHVGWPKITFDCISLHFRSIRNFDFFFTKWLLVAILDDRKSLSIAFLAISDKYTIYFFFSQNGCRWPFWMTENRFRSHFSPFQINTQLWLFFTIWLPVAILDDQKSLSIAFLAISDKYTFFSQNGCRRPFWMTENNFRSHFGSPICAKNNMVLPLCVINGYAKYEVDRWICDTVRDATSFLRIFYTK